MIAGAGLSMIGSGISAYGSFRAGQDEQRIGEWNANVAEMQAVDAIARGNVDETRSRIQTRALIGSQRASLAGQGVQVGDAGSSGDQVQIDAQRIGEEDALTIRNNAAREAWGYKVGATSMRMQGDAAMRRGRLQAISTIIGAGGSVAGSAAKA
jgi:hypothetical protein